MKVLHVTQVFLPYRGGSTIRLLNLLNHTAKIINIEQHVLVTRKNVAADCKSYDIYDSIHVHRVQSFYDMPFAFIKLNQRYKFDIIHIHNPRPYWFVRPFALGIPVITELHALQPLAWHKEVLAQFSYHWSDRIIVLSDVAKKYLCHNKSVAADKIVVVKNGVDYDRFQKVKSNNPVSIIKKTGPLIGYIGTFYRWQGIFELLESVKFVLNKMPDATFIFVGDGPEKETFKKRAKEISEDNIEILDQIAPHEVPAYVGKLNLFCMLRPRTRATELTLPLKIFEVGMSNTPLLVSDLPGLLEAGGNNPERFFNIQSDLSPQAVADHIVKLLAEDNVMSLSRKAQSYYEYIQKSDFSWKKSAEMLKDTYIGLLNESR